MDHPVCRIVFLDGRDRHRLTGNEKELNLPVVKEFYEETFIIRRSCHRGGRFWREHRVLFDIGWKCKFY
jgi:hypothetical protein